MNDVIESFSEIDLIHLADLLDLINLKDLIDLGDIIGRYGLIDVIDLIDLIAAIHACRTYLSQLFHLRYPPEFIRSVHFLLGSPRSSRKIEGNAIPLPAAPSTRSPSIYSLSSFSLELAPLFRKMEGEATSYRDSYSSLCSKTHLNREVITEIQKAQIAKMHKKSKPS